MVLFAAVRLTSSGSERMIRIERAYLAVARVVVTVYFRSPFLHESLLSPTGLISPRAFRTHNAWTLLARRGGTKRPREKSDGGFSFLLDNDNVSDFLHSLLPSELSRVFEESAGGPIDSFSPLGPLPPSGPRSPRRRLSLSLPLLAGPRPFVARSANRPAERSQPTLAALSSLSIRADSVELPRSKVRASNEAINKSTALTGLSTLFVRDDVSILGFLFLPPRTRGGPPPPDLLDSSRALLSAPTPGRRGLRLSSIKPSLPSVFSPGSGSPGSPFCARAGPAGRGGARGTRHSAVLPELVTHINSAR